MQTSTLLSQTLLGEIGSYSIPCYLPPDRSAGHVLNHSILSNFRIVESLNIVPEELWDTVLEMDAGQLQTNRQKNSNYDNKMKYVQTFDRALWHSISIEAYSVWQ